MNDEVAKAFNVLHQTCEAVQCNGADRDMLRQAAMTVKQALEAGPQIVDVPEGQVPDGSS